MENRYFVMCVIVKSAFPNDEKWNKKWPIGLIMHLVKRSYKIYEHALTKAYEHNRYNSTCKAYITNEGGQKIWMPDEVQELFKRLGKL